METVLENIATGVISLDSEGKITTINKAAEKMLHLNESDFRNNSYKDVSGVSFFDILKNIINENPGYTIQNNKSKN